MQLWEYDQRGERLHSWVLRDSRLRGNDGNRDFAQVSLRTQWAQSAAFTDPIRRCPQMRLRIEQLHQLTGGAPD